MKKALIAIVVILLLVGAGTAYYFLFMQTGQPDQVSEKSSFKPTIQEEDRKPILDLDDLPPEITQYYVIDRQVNVHNRPEPSALVVDTLYKGERVTVLEKTHGWYRISAYLVYSEGGEATAEWLDAKGLSDAEPVIKEQERLEILDGYLVKSDDLKEYLDMFRSKTQALLADNTCEPEDFEELGGWVRSVTYKKRSVYFIYCGGLEQANKVYLDADSGEIFRR